MKPQNIVLLVIFTIALTAGALATGYYWSQSDDEETDSAKTSQAAGDSSAGGLTVTDGSQIGQIGQSGDLNGNSGSTEPQNEFAQYEEYVNEQNVLFGEIAAGSGETAEPGDTLLVYYIGYLTDGTVFDATRTNESGEPVAFEFTLGAGEVIRGWDEGFNGLQEDGQRRLVVPPASGYGDSPQGQIPANSVLVFDVQLVEIQKASAGEAGPTEQIPETGL